MMYCATGQASTLPEPFIGRAERVLARQSDVLEQVMLAALGQVAQLPAPAPAGNPGSDGGKDACDQGQCHLPRRRKVPPHDGSAKPWNASVRHGQAFRCMPPAGGIRGGARSLDRRRLALKPWFL